MVTQKIIWTYDDYKYIGIREIKTEHEFFNTVCNIESYKLNEHQIEINTIENDMVQKYLIRMQNDEFGKKYSGSFYGFENDISGKVECELFENKNYYLLYGIWHEECISYVTIFLKK